MYFLFSHNQVPHPNHIEFSRNFSVIYTGSWIMLHWKYALVWFIYATSLGRRRRRPKALLFNRCLFRTTNWFSVRMTTNFKLTGIMMMISDMCLAMSWKSRILPMSLWKKLLIVQIIAQEVRLYKNHALNWRVDLQNYRLDWIISYYTYTGLVINYQNMLPSVWN